MGYEGVWVKRDSTVYQVNSGSMYPVSNLWQCRRFVSMPVAAPKLIWINSCSWRRRSSLRGHKQSRLCKGCVMNLEILKAHKACCYYVWTKSLRAILSMLPTAWNQLRLYLFKMQLGGLWKILTAQIILIELYYDNVLFVSAEAWWCATSYIPCW